MVGFIQTTKQGEKMKFHEFLDMYGIPITSAAKRIEVSPQHLSLILKGRVRPSKRLARDIAAYTRGAVSCDEVLAIRDHSVEIAYQLKCQEEENDLDNQCDKENLQQV